MNKEYDKFSNLSKIPIYQKGKEILEVVYQIGDLIPEDDEILMDIKGMMIHDAALLSVKVAGAEGGDLYDIRMEAATIIRKAAHDLILHNHSLNDHGFKYGEYYDIVRRLVEEYRLLFIEWVAGFDQWNYITDRWGLFNPPGISPFDDDSEDDVPGNMDFDD